MKNEEAQWKKRCREAACGDDYKGVALAYEDAKPAACAREEQRYALAISSLSLSLSLSLPLVAAYLARLTRGQAKMRRSVWESTGAGFIALISHRGAAVQLVKYRWRFVSRLSMPFLSSHLRIPQMPPPFREPVYIKAREKRIARGSSGASLIARAKKLRGLLNFWIAWIDVKKYTYEARLLYIRRVLSCISICEWDEIFNGDWLRCISALLIVSVIARLLSKRISAFFFQRSKYRYTDWIGFARILDCSEHLLCAP